jgi:hypothetical protein
MASRVEAAAPKEQSLRVVERVSPAAEEGTERWAEFRNVLARHSGERILVVLVGYPARFYRVSSGAQALGSAVRHPYYAALFP